MGNPSCGRVFKSFRSCVQVFSVLPFKSAGIRIKRLEYRFFFLYTHITPIAAVMISGNCFYSACKISCSKLADIRSTHSYYFFNLFCTFAFCSQLQSMKAYLSSFILVLLSCFDYYL